MSISPGEWMGDWGVLDCRLQIADCRLQVCIQTKIGSRKSAIEHAAGRCCVRFGSICTMLK